MLVLACRLTSSLSLRTMTQTLPATARSLDGRWLPALLSLTASNAGSGGGRTARPALRAAAAADFRSEVCCIRCKPTPAAAVPPPSRGGWSRAGGCWGSHAAAAASERATVSRSGRSTGRRTTQAYPQPQQLSAGHLAPPSTPTRLCIG